VASDNQKVVVIKVFSQSTRDR